MSGGEPCDRKRIFRHSIASVNGLFLPFKRPPTPPWGDVGISPPSASSTPRGSPPSDPTPPTPPPATPQNYDAIGRTLSSAETSTDARSGSNSESTPATAPTGTPDDAP